MQINCKINSSLEYCQTALCIFGSSERKSNKKCSYIFKFLVSFLLNFFMFLLDIPMMTYNFFVQKINIFRNALPNGTFQTKILSYSFISAVVYKLILRKSIFVFLNANFRSIKGKTHAFFFTQIDVILFRRKILWNSKLYFNHLSMILKILYFGNIVNL